MKKIQTVIDLFLIVIASALSAIGLYVFVNPANFAPSGIDGVSMMLQKITDINMGYISLAIKIRYIYYNYYDNIFRSADIDGEIEFLSVHICK